MKRLKKLLKKNRLILIIVFVLPVLFGRCNFIYDLYNETFDPYDHPVIEEGDTLVFRSQMTTDSLFVNDSRVHEPDPIMDDSKNKNYKCEMEQINCKDTCLNLEFTINWEYYFISYNYPFRINAYDPYSAMETIERKKAKYSLQIGEISLIDLYVLDFVRSDESHLFLEITSALYSKTYGIVQYTSHTGEKFNISEQTLEMLLAREL